MPLVKNKKGEHIVEISNLGEVSVTTDGLEALQTLTNTKLDTIATNTANIKISTDSVNLNVDTLETLVTATNAELMYLNNVNTAGATAHSLLAANVHHNDNKTHLSSVKSEIQYANNTGAAGSLAHSLLAGNVHHNDNKTHLLSIKNAVELLDNAISGNEMQVDIVSSALPSGSSTAANQVIIEASLTAMEAKMDTDNVVYDNQLTKLTEIDTAIDTIDTVLDASLVKQTNIETLITTLDGVQDNILTKLGEIETTNNSIQSAVEGTLTVGSHAVTNAGTFATQATCSGTVTANLGATDNAVLDDIAQKLGDIETAVQILDNAISGNEMQVDVVSMPSTTVSGTVTANLSATDNAVLDASLVKQTNIETLITTLDGVQDNILTKLGEIETTNNSIQSAVEGTLTVGSHAVTNAGTFATQAVCSGTVTANLGATDNAVLDDIAQKLGDIETAVQILDNAISGNEMQVDVISMPSTTVSGTVTANLSATDNAVLDAIETTNNAIQSAVEGTLTVGSHAVTNAGTFAVQAACSGTVTANLGATDNAVLDDIAQKLGDIETAVQILDNAISGNEMQVDIVSIPTTTVSGTVTANLSATDNAVLDSMATDLAALEVLNTSILAKIQPTRDVVTIFNNATLGADATLPSSEIDMLNFRHIRIVGFSDEDDKTGQVQIHGATSSGGSFFDMGYSGGTYSASIILVPTIENIPVRYIKLVVTDQTGGSSNLNVFGFRLN